MNQDNFPRYPDIFSLLSTQAQNYPSAVAIEAPGKISASYGILLEKVQTIMGSLQALGVSRASRVAIVFPNGPEMATVLLGVSCAAIAAPLNPLYREEEFAAYFSEMHISFLLVLKGWESVASEVAQQQGISLLEYDHNKDTITTKNNNDFPEGNNQSPVEHVSLQLPQTNDIALILLTSGSTGRSKKVPLSHNNLCTSVYDICRSLRLSREDRCLSMWEQFHIGGLVDLLLAPFASGGTVICAGGFSASRFFPMIEEYSPTWFQGVPATLNELLINGKKIHWSGSGSSLRLIRSVAAALSPRLHDDLEALFHVPIIQTFGMTEAGPLITTNPLPPHKQKRGSVGKLCGPELAVMDAHGKPKGTWELGEIAVRGDNVISGYENNPEANAQSFRQGWFYTGDTGLVDSDGYVFLKGRVKEMINRGGEKVILQELDDVLLQHPDVEQAAAFGMAHPTLGEEVGAALVLKDQSSLTEPSVQEFVAQRLSDFKVPRRVLFLEDLPKTPVGKINRLGLSDIAEDRQCQTPYVPPGNDLEVFLTKIWERELAVDRVGIDDNFSDLGGDSLSSVRLISTVEILLDRRLPEKGLSTILTVREMAKFMEEHGCAQLPSMPDGKDGLKTGFADSEIQSIQSLVAMGSDSKEGQREDILDKFRSCHTIHQFKALNESLLKHLTPSEALSLANQRAGKKVWEMVTPLFWKKKRWQQDIRKEIQGQRAPLSWMRREVTESASFFSSGQTPDPGKTLIVGFAGNHMRLMLPHFRFLMHLDDARFDMLFLWDPKRKHFERGIHGFGNDMSSMNKGLAALVDQWGYTKVVAIGTSAGGLAAISAGLANNWNRSVAVGPDLLIKHPAIEQGLKKTFSNGQPFTEVLVFYAGRNKRDCASVGQLLSVVPHTQKNPFETMIEHSVLNEVYKGGQLRDLFKTFFELEPEKREASIS